MAAPRKPAKSKSLQGAALIEAVIDAIQAHKTKLHLLGECGKSVQEPKGLSEDVVDGLRLPGDKPLSPSMRRWLTYDVSWLGWFKSLKKPEFPVMKLDGLIAHEFGGDDFLVPECRKMAKRFLPAHCLPLHHGADSRRFLYLGETDDVGEYPVLVVDTDDVPFFGMEHAGLDEYLAACANVKFNARPMRERTAQHVERNLHGYAQGFELVNDLMFDDDGNVIDRGDF
jgi:hypothetical protein